MLLVKKSTISPSTCPNPLYISAIKGWQITLKTGLSTSHLPGR